MKKTSADNQQVIATLTVHDWEKFTKKERERFFLWMRKQILSLADYDNRFSKRFTARMYGKVKK